MGNDTESGAEAADRSDPADRADPTDLADPTDPAGPRADLDAVVREQVAYYRARAREYDRFYAERDDLRVLLPVLDDLPIAGDVLELACGTGQWTGRLAARARSVTALDAAPETLAIARERVTSPIVQFACADLVAWREAEKSKASSAA